MYLDPKEKQEIFAKHGKSATDTGNTEGQIALFTYRIEHLTGHLKANHKDYNTERSLVKLVLSSVTFTCMIPQPLLGSKITEHF